MTKTLRFGLSAAALAALAWLAFTAGAPRAALAQEHGGGEHPAGGEHPTAEKDGTEGHEGGGEKDAEKEKHHHSFLWAMFIVQVAGFAALAWVFWKYVRPAATKALDDRGEKFRSAFGKIDATEAELKQALADYEHKLTHTGDEAGRRMQKALADAAALVAEMKAEADLQAQAIHGRIAGELALERDKILLEVRQTVIGSAFAAAESELARRLPSDTRKQAALVEKTLQEVESVRIPGF